MVENIVMSLTGPWKSKVTAITENLKFATLTLDQLRGNFIAYENTLLKEEIEAKRKQPEKTLKAKEKETPKEDTSQEVQPNEKEMALITKRLYSSSKKRQQCRRRQKESSSRYELSKDNIICFEYQKPGHIRADCPQLKEKGKKKAMAINTTQSDDDFLEESDEDLEVANLCLIAEEEDSSDEEEQR